MGMWAKCLLLGFALCLLLFLPPAYGGSPVHGSKAAAMGTAFVGLADDASAILHNPAGLTQRSGTSMYGGVTFVVPSTTFEPSAGPSQSTDFQMFFPPHLFVSSDLATKDLRLGLGVFSPFGIGGRKWSRDGLTRFISVKNLTATLAVNPVLAYQLLPNLSVAAGVDYMYAKSEATRMIDQSLTGAADGVFDLDADGGGWGYNLGILFTPSEKVSVGLAYRSRIKIDFKGDVDLNDIAPALQPFFGGSSFSTTLRSTSTFPGIASLGIAYKPTVRLTLCFDAEWVNWSTFRSTDIDVRTEVPQAAFTDVSIPLNWKDQWLFKAGVDYRVTQDISVRGGYAYVQSPVPESSLDPGKPDAAQHNFTAGLGCRSGKWVFDISYMAAFYLDRSVNNAILSGSYDNFAHYFGVSVGYTF